MYARVQGLVDREDISSSHIFSICTRSTRPVHDLYSILYDPIRCIYTINSIICRPHTIFTRLYTTCTRSNTTSTRVRHDIYPIIHDHYPIIHDFYPTASILKGGSFSRFLNLVFCYRVAIVPGRTWSGMGREEIR